MALLPEHLWLFVRKHLEGSAFRTKMGTLYHIKNQHAEHGCTVSPRSGFGQLHLIVGTAIRLYTF